MIFVPEAKTVHSHCPHCARELAEDFGYCPGCGRETSEIQRCENCGYLQVIPSSGGTRYCVKCGNPVGSSELEV